MAELPAPDDAARTLLAVCRDLNLRPGDPLPGHPIWHRTVGSLRLTQEEFKNGIDRAVELGWFERNNGGHVLTAAGFKEM